MIRPIVRRLSQGINRSLEARLDELRLVCGSGVAHMFRQLPPKSFAEAGFRVFSQFDDDGLIQYLTRSILLSNTSFIEFGVEDYRESNTRFLLENDNWRGLVMDGGAENIRRIKSSSAYWRHDLTALEAFITKDNINNLIADAGYSGPIGILSIDIDGVDWWVWQAITVVEPDIVIAEYNSVFGRDRAVTVPYDQAFQRTRAHYSNLYWGCSLRALDVLATERGYAFVGCNRAGNNAYFVKETKLGSLETMPARDGYVESRFRESRGEDNRLTLLNGKARLKPIQDLELWEIEQKRMIRVSELQG